MIEMQHMAAHVITSGIAWTTTHNKHRQASVCFVACWGGHNWGGYFLWWHFFGQGQEQRGICHSRWHNVWSLDLPGFAYKLWGMGRMLSKTIQIHSERPNETWSMTPRSLDVYYCDGGGLQLFQFVWMVLFLNACSREGQENSIVGTNK